MSKKIDLEKVAEKAWSIANEPDFDQFEACTALKDAALAIKQAQETIATLEKDAARWKKVVHRVGADNFLHGAQFVIRGIPAPINVMRGSVAEHFTKAIDTAMEASNAKAD